MYILCFCTLCSYATCEWPEFHVNKDMFCSVLFYIRASDFFQNWWADVTNRAKNGGSFSEMMGPSISNLTQLTFG